MGIYSNFPSEHTQYRIFSLLADNKLLCEPLRAQIRYNNVKIMYKNAFPGCVRLGKVVPVVEFADCLIRKVRKM
jgi:hypothetical protein